MGCPRCWLCVLLHHQLVDAAVAHPRRRGDGTLYPHDFHWLHLPDDGWSVDEQIVEAQSDGGRFQPLGDVRRRLPKQERKREFSAGDTADGERVFRQSAYTFLLHLKPLDKGLA